MPPQIPDSLITILPPLTAAIRRVRKRLNLSTGELFGLYLLEKTGVVTGERRVLLLSEFQRSLISGIGKEKAAKVVEDLVDRRYVEKTDLKKDVWERYFSDHNKPGAAIYLNASGTKAFNEFTGDLQRAANEFLKNQPDEIRAYFTGLIQVVDQHKDLVPLLLVAFTNEPSR